MIVSAVRPPSARAAVALPASARPVILRDHDLILLPRVAVPRSRSAATVPRSLPAAAGQLGSGAGRGRRSSTVAGGARLVSAAQAQ